MLPHCCLRSPWLSACTSWKGTETGNVKRPPVLCPARAAFSVLALRLSLRPAAGPWKLSSVSPICDKGGCGCLPSLTTAQQRSCRWGEVRLDPASITAWAKRWPTASHPPEIRGPAWCRLQLCRGSGCWAGQSWSHPAALQKQPVPPQARSEAGLPPTSLVFVPVATRPPCRFFTSDHNWHA